MRDQARATSLRPTTRSEAGRGSRSSRCRVWRSWSYSPRIIRQLPGGEQCMPRCEHHRRSPHMMPFSKGHGLENDYLVLREADLPGSLSGGAIRRICDRNWGVGSDGILLLVASERADFGL